MDSGLRGHGVARVDGEVQEDLFEHAEVGLDGGQRGGKVEIQRDVLAEDAPQHLADVADRLIQINELGLEHLLAAEGEELPGEFRRRGGRPPRFPSTARRFGG